MLTKVNVDYIIWVKKDGVFRCQENNCNIKHNIKLTSYAKTTTFKENYLTLLSNNDMQIVNNVNSKIILKKISDGVLIEIRIHSVINLHLLSIISHKIRNPLTNILGLLPFIESKLPNSDYINILKKSSYDIISVINDLIDIVNSNRGDLKITNDIVDVNNLIQDCYNTIRYDLLNKNLTIKIVIDTKVSKTIITDRIRLKQIIINLLNNAIQNTRDSNILFTISLFEKDKSNICPFDYTEVDDTMQNILFTIKDNGCGMDTDAKKYVEFILGINKLINNYKFGGMGLIISKWICNLFNGNIWFVSEKDIGSVFYFNIISKIYK